MLTLGPGMGELGVQRSGRRSLIPRLRPLRETTPQSNFIHAFISFFLLRYVLFKKMSQLEKTENRLATLKMSLLKSFHSEI